MRYLLDTNIILFYLKNATQSHWINENYDLFASNNQQIISVVTLGEIRALSLKNYWGIQRFKKLEALLPLFIIADIHSEDVIQRYAEIDAFSQNKLKDMPLKNSARNMGKNDLWIAATASVSNARLMTSDNDFDHLEGTFIELITVGKR